jgi:hypothetical protein
MSRPDPTRTPMPDAVLARIRKILAKAEDPAATPAEAEVYTAKAAELVAAYGIDAALLSERAPGTDTVGNRLVVLDAPYALDKAGLLNGVAAALRCRAVQRTRYDAEGAKEISMHLFGFESDLARAEVLYTSLLLQATSAVRRATAPAWENLAAYRRSWLAGFTSAVVSRLHEAEDRARTSAESERRCSGGSVGGGRSVALVLADRSVEVSRAVEQEYPSLQRGGRRHLSGSGRRSGYQAGQRADLGGTRLRGGRRQLPAR